MRICSWLGRGQRLCLCPGMMGHLLTLFAASRLAFVPVHVRQRRILGREGLCCMHVPVGMHVCVLACVCVCMRVHARMNVLIFLRGWIHYM